MWAHGAAAVATGGGAELAAGAAHAPTHEVGGTWWAHGAAADATGGGAELAAEAAAWTSVLSTPTGVGAGLFIGPSPSSPRCFVAGEPALARWWAAVEPPQALLRTRRRVVPMSLVACNVKFSMVWMFSSRSSLNFSRISQCLHSSTLCRLPTIVMRCRDTVVDTFGYSESSSSFIVASSNFLVNPTENINLTLVSPAPSPGAAGHACLG